MSATVSLSSTIFDFPCEYPIGEFSFRIPGLGRAGPLCGHQRMSHFSSDGGAVRYDLLRCRRIECPTCWSDWARRAVFDLALRVEAYARHTGKRPYSCIFSVSPERVKRDSWTWERVNRSLFRRGYRRSRIHGVDGGIAIFHPYRIRPSWKHGFRRSGERREFGMWKIIRKRVQAGEPLSEFVRLGPHTHTVVFGEPKAHVCDDFVLAFRDDENGVPKKLKTSKDVVGFLMYLITHSGVLTHLKKYNRGVQRRKTHTVRAFGCVHRVDPTALLSRAEFGELAREIAGLVGMVWIDGELRYPASSKDFETSDEAIEWISIHLLGKYLSDERWLTSLSYYQASFWLAVNKWMVLNDRPPDLDELKPPDDVSVYAVLGVDDVVP